MSPQPQMPALVSTRTAFLIFAPLVILVAAALVTNLGGGVAKDANAAADINISASINSNKHFTSMCGTSYVDTTPADGDADNPGTMSFGALGSDVVPAPAQCDVVYGSNDDTELRVQGLSGCPGACVGSNTAGMTGFTPVAGNCTDISSGALNGQIGIRAASATGGTNPTRLAAFACGASEYSPIPTTATGICDVDAGVDSTCRIEMGLDTGGVASGSKNGKLRLTLA